MYILATCVRICVVALMVFRAVAVVLSGSLSSPPPSSPRLARNCLRSNRSRIRPRYCSTFTTMPAFTTRHATSQLLIDIVWDMTYVVVFSLRSYRSYIPRTTLSTIILNGLPAVSRCAHLLHRSPHLGTRHRDSISVHYGICPVWWTFHRAHTSLSTAPFSCRLHPYPTAQASVLLGAGRLSRAVPAMDGSTCGVLCLGPALVLAQLPPDCSLRAPGQHRVWGLLAPCAL